MIYDDDNDIALFKVYEYLGNIFGKCLERESNNEMFKTIFRETGISNEISNYTSVLSPYTYNGYWRNSNLRFNPKGAFYEIYTNLDDKHKFLFIRSIIQNMNAYDLSIDKLKNQLLLLGYSLINNSEIDNSYTIKQTERGLFEREKIFRY